MRSDVCDRLIVGYGTRPRVLVFHPGKQHSYETALASAKVGALRAFITSIYYGAGPFQPRLYHRLPAAQRRRLDNWLKGRSHPDLQARLVEAKPWIHMAQYMTERLLPWSPRWRYADLLLDRAVSRGLGKYECNVVHGFEGSCPLTLRAAKRSGALAVLDVPSSHEYLVKVSREEGEKLDERWQRFEESVVHRERLAADFLLVASDLPRTCLLEDGVPSGKIVKIPYGVDADRFVGAPPGGKRDEFRVLYAGKINARKGVRYLLQAWRDLGLRNAELTLVGPPDDHGRRLLDEYRGHYRWLGNLSYREVHREFQRADLFVCPSLAETGPLVVYEAMASSLPVVTTANAPAVVRDGVDGFIVPTRASRTLADRILWLREHPEERQEMGRSGRQRILSSYTWHHYHQRLVCAYQAMLEGRPPNEAIGELESSWAKRANAEVKR